MSFTKKRAIENVYTSKLTLVDLAGSERQSSTNGTSERLMVRLFVGCTCHHSISIFKETCQINKSLFVLGRVISQLSGNSQAKAVFRSTERPGRKRPKLEFEGISPLLTPQTLAKRKNNTFVSYRDSLLTWYALGFYLFCAFIFYLLLFYSIYYCFPILSFCKLQFHIFIIFELVCYLKAFEGQSWWQFDHYNACHGISLFTPH